MLSEAGIKDSDCRFTNVFPWRPPNNDVGWYIFSSKKAAAESGDAVYYKSEWVRSCVPYAVEELEREIRDCRPNLVIGVGNTPLWALTGNSGVTKWRGSLLWLDHLKVKFLTTYHPAYVQRMWSARWIMVNDLKRGARESATDEYTRPKYHFQLAPTFQQAVDQLRELEHCRRVAVDVETRNREIACVGFAWTPRDAICIPFISALSPLGYYSLEEEVELYQAIGRVFRAVECVGHFFMYDMQYFAKQLGCVPKRIQDTMTMHHCCFPGTPKSLAFVASIYNENYVYWKEDDKEWVEKRDESLHWTYNCMDGVNTLEASTHLDHVIDVFGLREQYTFLVREMWFALRMMLRGLRVDAKQKAKLAIELMERMIQTQEFIEYVIGYKPQTKSKDANWLNSPQQVAKLFYEVLQLPKQHDPKTRSVTTNEPAVEFLLHTCEPLYRPILRAIIEWRSLKVYKSTFADAAVSPDGFMRSTLDVCGTKTFRFASSEDAFGYGTNQLNIPGEEQ